ncbi:MAG: DUF5752 family protein [Deltaproteobacteria bacterium]|nr:DUF5752 family protein [Deltaproteobacteria bacterium]
MADVFQFSSSASLEMLTGQKAYNLEELLHLLRSCRSSSVFYHTFSAFLKLREAEVPYNSDFAIWAATSLNEKALAEKLMAVDFSEYSTTEDLRSRLIEIIETHRSERPAAFEKTAEDPFYLYDITRVVYLTDKFAYDLASFRENLEHISIYSLYLHFIESRLQKLEDNDFSRWIEDGLRMPGLAEQIRKIDLNMYTIEGLRSRILELIEEHAAS